MKEMEVVTLEDNNDYIVIERIDNYIYLTKEDDKEYFAIRKVIFENNEEYFCGLDDESEFEKAFSLFINKFKDMI